MPPFYFHLFDGLDKPDEDGSELPNVAAARSQAVITAGEMLRDTDGRFWEGPHEWRMTVLDEQGRTVCLLQFVGEMPG